MLKKGKLTPALQRASQMFIRENQNYEDKYSLLEKTNLSRSRKGHPPLVVGVRLSGSDLVLVEGEIEYALNHVESKEDFKESRRARNKRIQAEKKEEEAKREKELNVLHFGGVKYKDGEELVAFERAQKDVRKSKNSKIKEMKVDDYDHYTWQKAKSISKIPKKTLFDPGYGTIGPEENIKIVSRAKKSNSIRFIEKAKKKEVAKRIETEKVKKSHKEKIDRGKINIVEESFEGLFRKIQVKEAQENRKLEKLQPKIPVPAEEPITLSNVIGNSKPSKMSKNGKKMPPASNRPLSPTSFREIAKKKREEKKAKKHNIVAESGFESDASELTEFNYDDESGITTDLDYSDTESGCENFEYHENCLYCKNREFEMSNILLIDEGIVSENGILSVDDEDEKEALTDSFREAVEANIIEDDEHEESQSLSAAKLHFERDIRLDRADLSDEESVKRAKRSLNPIKSNAYDVASDFHAMFITVKEEAPAAFSSLINFLMDKFKDLVHTVLSKDFRVILVYLYQCYYAKSTLQVLAAFHQMVYALSHGTEIFDLLCDKASSIIQRYSSAYTDNVAEAYSGPTNFLERVMSSELVTSIRDVILMTLSYKWFSEDISSKLYYIFGDIASNRTMMGFINTIIKCLNHLYMFGRSILEGVPVCDALFAEDPLYIAASTINDLVAREKFVYKGLPVEGYISIIEFMTQLKDNCFILKAGVKTMSPRHSSYRGYIRTLTEGEVCYASKLTELQSEERMTPFCVVTHGSPGIGKSYIHRFICELWSEVKGRKFQQSHVYSRDASRDFWDGYNPFSNPIIHYSELGKYRPEISRVRGDTAIGEFLSLADNLPMLLNYSAIEDKGKWYALPELMSADTNNKEMNIKQEMFCPAAPLRRPFYLGARVKEEYRIEGSSMIDMAKSFADTTTNLLDRYEWTVSKYIPIETGGGSVGTTLRILLQTGDFNELVHFMRKAMRDHIAKEEAAVKRLTKIVIPSDEKDEKDRKSVV